MAVILGSWSRWTNYQIQTWRDVETHLLHAWRSSPITGTCSTTTASIFGSRARSKTRKRRRRKPRATWTRRQTCHQKSVALKDNAKAQWIHGITARPTATDIHSNLGYAYSEANDLDKAEWHLNRP